MSTVKFVYRSQNIPDTQPIQGSQRTITSGAVYDALQSTKIDSLFKSGYLSEGVASYKNNHVLTFADGVLTLKAGSKVYVPYGYKEGEFEFNEVTIPSDLTLDATHSYDNDAFIMVDTTDMKLIAGMKKANKVSNDEILDSTVQAFYAQTNEPPATTTYSYWWDINENIMKYCDVSAEEWYPNGDNTGHAISMPLCIVHCQDNDITGIQQDFNIGGIAEDMCWINPGLMLSIPVGKDEDNTYLSKTIEIQSVMAKQIFEDMEAFEDYGIYITLDGEIDNETANAIIEGPIEELTFSNEKGVFVDGDNNIHYSCRVMLLSADHLTTGAADKLVTTSLSLRPVVSLADSDDIEYVIRLIGSSMGLTIDDLTEMLANANEDRKELREQVYQWLADTKDTVVDELHHCITHRQMPFKRYFIDSLNDKHDYIVRDNLIGIYGNTEENPATGEFEYDPMTFVPLTKVEGNTYEDEAENVYTLVVENIEESVLKEDIKLDETINGVKTFTETIVGDISGQSNTVKLTKNVGGFITPVGITDDDEENLQYIKTDVKIFEKKVEADTFDGVATTAKWADLAEIYETDAEYRPGTLLRWGGEKELTLANFGIANAVVSEKPAVLMNSSGVGQPIALAGRVRVRVLGKCKKHDAIVLNEMAPGTGKVQESVSEPIIARCLEDNDFVGEKLVLCVVKFSL